MKVDPVEIWLSKMEKRHSRSDNTVKRYRNDLRFFCSFIDSTPEQIVDNWKAIRYDLRAREEYIDEMLEKIDVYEKHLGEKGLTKTSISAYLTGVQSFFKYMRIPVKVELFNAKVVYHNRDITKEEIKRILNNSTPRDKAFYLMMVQSGLRPITLMQLTYAQIKNDFDAERIPCLIDVPRKMAKGEYMDHFSFMGPDAVNALKLYFRERGFPSYSEKIFTGVKTVSAFSMRFGYYVRTLGLIKPENMREGRKPQPLRLYCLRKYFRNMAQPAGPDYVNFWMGHKTSYEAPQIPGSDVHYFSRDVERHRKQYEQFAMPNLRIRERSALDFDAQLRDKTEEIEELRQKVVELDKRNLELKQRLNGYVLSDSQVQELLRRIEKLEKQARKQNP